MASTVPFLGYHDIASHALMTGAQREQKPTEKILKATPARVTLQPWEQKVDAVYVLLVMKKIVSVDIHRRHIEAMPLAETPNATADSMPYYFKWASSLASTLKENNLLTEEEICDAIGGLHQQRAVSVLKPSFEKGDVVVVKDERDAMPTLWRRPHIRVPGYVFGATGVIERVVGVFKNPEVAAFRMNSGAKMPLYRVSFTRDALCKRIHAKMKDERCGKNDKVEVEIFEHWLRAKSVSDDEEANGAINGRHDAETDEKVTKRARVDHEDNHNHDHEHLSRMQVEQDAVIAEPKPHVFQQFAEGIINLILKKGIVSADEMRQVIEKAEQMGSKMEGARLVARAWKDSSFKERLLKDANSAAKELNIQASNTTSSTCLTVLENTPEVHNLVVCTLCSCYPRSILGMAPSWYKSSSYRSKAVLEPRSLLLDCGLKIDDDVEVRVHDSTADCRYMVLPLMPQGVEEWSEEQLQSIITRDSMIGVSVIQPPSMTATEEA